MSLKGALPKTGDERANLHEEPFVTGEDEEVKTPSTPGKSAAANNQTPQQRTN